jgi:hypothetical protein
VKKGRWFGRFIGFGIGLAFVTVGALLLLANLCRSNHARSLELMK